MGFDRIVRGGGVLTQEQGDTAFGRACHCEWNCPGHEPYAYHAGIDIAVAGNPPGVILTAVGSGRCVRVGRVLLGYQCTGLGPFAPCIRSGDVDVWYGHASKSLVTEGQLVRAGDPVAIMGAVGCAWGQHVHYEVLAAGADPDGCGALRAMDYVDRWPGDPAPAPDPVGGLLVPGLLLAGAAAVLASRSSSPRSEPRELPDTPD